MNSDDELWPPFGAGAAFRHGQAAPAPRDADRREWHDAGRPAPFGRTGTGSRAQWPGPEARRPRPEPGPRGRDRGRPALTRDDIVAAAISIADLHGSEAVSMRRIAQVLNAGAMSLYWHLASKEHLLELMLDAINGEVYVPEPTGNWRADLRAQACSTRLVLLRHQWVVDFFSSRPPLGPNTLRALDKMLATLESLEIDLSTAINIFQTVNTYVSGVVIREFQEIRTQREQEEFVSGDAEFLAKLEEWKRALADSGKFAHFLKMLEDGVDPDAEATRDERFEFGLDCMLEGIAAKLAKKPAGDE